MVQPMSVLLVTIKLLNVDYLLEHELEHENSFSSVPWASHISFGPAF